MLTTDFTFYPVEQIHQDVAVNNGVHAAVNWEENYGAHFIVSCGINLIQGVEKTNHPKRNPTQHIACNHQSDFGLQLGTPRVLGSGSLVGGTFGRHDNRDICCGDDSEADEIEG